METCAAPSRYGWLAYLRSRGWISASIVLAGLLIILFILSFTMGRYPVPPLDVIGIIWGKLFHLDVSAYGDAVTVVWNLRLPRIIAAVLIGGSLSVAGASFQGLFRNPLVSPDILGVSSGAGFGAALGIIISGNPYVVQILAFVFGMAAVLVAFGISRMVRSNPTLSLILSGMAIGSLFGAFLSLMKYIADPTDQLPTIVYWLMGSLNGIDKPELLAAGIPMTIGLLVLLLIRWRLNVLAMGEEEALALGVDTNKLRIIVILCCTVMTASAVCISGVIGWVGLVIPHIGRSLVGPCHKRMLPVAALLGGVFLLLIDDIARTALSVELPIGILTAIIGVPFFLYLLARGRKGWL